MNYNLVSALLVFGALSIGVTQLPAFGQTLGFDESSSVIVNDKRVALTLEMRPLFVIEDDKDGSVVIRLREVNTNVTIPHVTYQIKMMRTSELLVDDRFHSHEGILSLRIEHTQTDKVEVIGNRESLYDAMIADLKNPAVVKGSILDGGLYHYNIMVLSMSEYENKLSEPLNFDLYASIGKTSPHEVLDADGKQHTLSIKTYYDQIIDHGYDSSSRVLTFRMPLNWNVNYLSQVPFVHEEVQIRQDFTELMSNSYLGTINSVELSNKEVMIDDYSYENTRTVHFMVGKDKLIRIAQKQKPDQNMAVFTLMPREVPKFPLEILSEKENFLLQIGWSPSVIEPQKPTKFIVTLRDPKTLDTLRHSSADLVLQKDGNEIFRGHHRAPIGAIVQDYTFTEEQSGTILLLVENINNTGESARLLFTVVPEFTSSPFVAMVAVLSAAIIIAKVRSLRTSW
ncbi:MAG: hypothetical protein ACE5KA_01450 [Nitrososphaerales archaeon]